MIQRDNSISSRIVLSCKLIDNKTMLEDSYFDIPYKIVHYGSRHLQDHLEIMMMCYSPGVMDGDNLHIDVHCPAGTEMKLFTQSFNKLHPMKKGAAQYTKVRIEAGASFQYLPQPMIPFKDSIFLTTNEIFMEGNSHLIWGDIISGGRIHSGERFEFKRIHSKTKVYADGKLIFFDNQLMEPSSQPMEDMLFFEGKTHQGTLLLVSPYAIAFKEELDALLTEQFTDLSYGFTQCGPNALMVRTLGESGDAMHEWLANIGDMCWSFIKYKEEQEQLVVKPVAKKKAVKQQPDSSSETKPVKKKAGKKTEKVITAKTARRKNASATPVITRKKSAKSKPAPLANAAKTRAKSVKGKQKVVASNSPFKAIGSKNKPESRSKTITGRTAAVTKKK